MKPSGVEHDATLVAPSEIAPSRATDTIAAVSAGELIAGRYEIVGLLGAGGMGSVYRVRDVELDEHVALKLLRRELGESQGMLARFRQEVKLARRVTHRNVARTYDIGDHGGGLLLTMELIEGESLARRLERAGAMDAGAAIAIALDICSGLGAAHEAGVVHRDLKPDNVILARDGRAVITDFGIARAHARSEEDAARTAGIIGTPAYMAPEQAEGAGDLDARADLYALGELLYEMLTGQRAWPAELPLVAAAARLTSPPPDPRALSSAVSDELAGIVLKLLARRREDRFSTAAETAAVLTAVRDRPAGQEKARVHIPRADAEPSGPRYAAPPPGDKTVAVLPLRNLGVEDYVVDGILEDLIDTLSMTRGLRVRPIGVVAKYKGASVDAREVGRELGVQVVVEASIRAMGPEYRLGARVVSVEDGFQVWAKRFQAPIGDILQSSDEAARAIAAALTTDLDAPARDAADPLAAELYLRARAELRGAWHTVEQMTRVVETFDDAVARAPRDPRALALGALAHARLAFYGLDAERHTLTSRDLAERAIAIAPQLADPWIAIATLRVDAGDAAGAVAALHSALRLAPKTAKALEMLGRLLLEAGEIEQAKVLFTSALELDSSTPEPRWDLARAYALGREWEKADALLALPVDTGAGRVMRAYAIARYSLWRPQRADAPPPSDYPRIGVVAGVVAALHEVARERVLSADVQRFFEGIVAASSSRIRPLALQTLAEIELATDAPRLDFALDQVRASVDGGLVDIGWMDCCPLLAPLRTDPAWGPLRARVEARAAHVRAAAREPRPRSPAV